MAQGHAPGRPSSGGAAGNHSSEVDETLAGSNRSGALLEGALALVEWGTVTVQWTL